MMWFSKPQLFLFYLSAALGFLSSDLIACIATIFCDIRNRLTTIFHSFMYLESTPVYGNKYGSGTGPILTVCPTSFSSYSVDFTPIANCSSVPLNLSCSAHELDVSVRCSKGQGEIMHPACNGERHINSPTILIESTSNKCVGSTIIPLQRILGGGGGHCNEFCHSMII